MNDLTKVETANLPSPFQSLSSFEDSQRIAKALASSKLVPDNYQNNLPDCLVAMELSTRVGISVFAAMQNLYVIHGRPSWSAQFLISMINSCGRFKPLQFRLTGKGDDRGCVAHTEDHDGNTYESTIVTIGMAKAEGWYGRKGSKWPSMPDQMLCYRAAAFFSRLHCPELALGMQTSEELADTGGDEINITSMYDNDAAASAVPSDAGAEVGGAETGVENPKQSSAPATDEKPPKRRRARRSGPSAAEKKKADAEAAEKKRIEEAEAEKEKVIEGEIVDDAPPFFDDDAGPRPGDDTDGLPF